MRRITRVLPFVLSLATILIAEDLKNPVRLQESRVDRGDQFTVTIENGPQKTNGGPVIKMTEVGGGNTQAEAPTYIYASGAAGAKNIGIATGTVPATIPFGDYQIAVQLDNRTFRASGVLSIRPAATPELHLTEISPKNTYEWQDVWIANPVSTDKKEAQTISVRTVRMKLTGTGFLPRAEDNSIWLNGVRQTKIRWDGCTQSLTTGNQNAPVELETHGELVSTQEIQLCRVPVPENGQMTIRVGYGNIQSEKQSFRVFSMTEAQVASQAFIIATILALIPLFLLSFAKRAYAIGNARYKLRMLFLDPETDTYSLSKLQFYLWTVASIFGYAYLFLSFVKVQNLPWPDVPATLPGIIAVSAGTAVGSQLISASKGSKGAGEQWPNVSDFITSGGVVAPDRLQMLLWTLFGVGAFFVAVLEQGPGTISGLPAIPDRLLFLMGISSAGYLGGKIARKAGPVINEISLQPAESDESIAKTDAPAANLPDFTQAITEMQSQIGAFPPISNAHAKGVVDSATDAIKTVSAAHTISELNELMTSLGTIRSKAETEAVGAAQDFGSSKATSAEAQAAQQAAAALQDFSANIAQAISQAASEPMQTATQTVLIARTIELRGTNMSPDALFEIDHADLPFRMLFNKDGQNAPDIILPDDTTPTFAKVLRLTIDPARLSSADLLQFNKWFSTDGVRTLTITNPDGQKAELTFSLPPGATQKVGTTA